MKEIMNGATKMAKAQSQAEKAENGFAKVKKH